MVSSYEYYFTDGSDHANDHNAYDKNDHRSQPQHVATPHGAMTEILAATGSTSPPSPRHIKQHRQPASAHNRPSSNKETVAKKALRLKAAKHFHRGNSSSSSENVGSSNKNSQNDLPSTAQSKGVHTIRASNKYYYPEECSSTVQAAKQQEEGEDRKDDDPSPNIISPSSNNSSGTSYDQQLDKIIEDDPAIEIYEEESASEIGSGYNSGSDLENAARKILRRRSVGSKSKLSKQNYDSDDNASDTGSAVSSTASSSFRKLPDGWKERIKRKAGMPKLPPTMDKKEKQPQPKSDAAHERQQQQKQPLPLTQKQEQEQPPGKDNEINLQDSDGGNQYHNHFSAIASACEDSDDDEYYQDHFNGNANVNGAFPSFSNEYNYEGGSSGIDILNHPPIYEEHVFGPVKPSTIYESNDEDEQDENDSLFDGQEWNPDYLTSSKNDGGANDDSKNEPIQEVDESGFPSPSRKARSHDKVHESGFPSPSSTKEDQQLSVQTADNEGSNFNEDEYFHQFTNRDWELNFLPPPGVKWKSSKSTKQETASLATDDDILTAFIHEEETTAPSFAWSDSSFFENVGTSAIAEQSALNKMEEEGNEKDRDLVTRLPSRTQDNKRERVTPAMQPFSDGDLSDPGNDISNVEDTVANTTQVKRGLKFFKRRGRGYHSEGERSDSEWDKDASKSSPMLKGMSPLRRKNKQKKQSPKTNELRRKLFGSSPKKADKNCPPAPAKKAVTAASPTSASGTNIKPSIMVTPIVSNAATKMDDSKPFSSVDVKEDKDAEDDKTISTLGSIITKETSSKARVASSGASANTAMSEIERLRKENDKLRHELERQAVRRENERLRLELEKRSTSGATSPDKQRHTTGVSPSDMKHIRQKSPRKGNHKMSLESLLENDGKGDQRYHRHHVTKNHLMNRADFDDESTTTYSPVRRSRRFEYASESLSGATEWVASQMRQAAQGQRPLDCFTACARSDRGHRRRRRRRHRARGAYGDNDSDTDSLEDDSLVRTEQRPRPSISRRSK